MTHSVIILLKLENAPLGHKVDITRSILANKSEYASDCVRVPGCISTLSSDMNFQQVTFHGGRRRHTETEKKKGECTKKREKRSESKKRKRQ